MSKVCWVIGVGKGIGAACMRRWVKSGFKVAISARTREKVEGFAKEDPAIKGYPADVTDPGSLAAAVGNIEAELGPIHTVVYNAGSGVWKSYRELSLEDLDSSIRTNTHGLLAVAKLVCPKMEAAGEGVIAITGATSAWRGKPKTPAFAAAKASQKMLAQGIAKDVGPKGVHVFYVVVDGSVDPSGSTDSRLSADAIAQTFHDIAHQPRSCWTFEIDVRPCVEPW